MDRVFHSAARTGKLSSETAIIRQVEIDGRKYAVALYFPRGEYWKWMISRFPIYMGSFIFPLYMLGTELHSKVAGIKLMDMDANTIPYNKDLYLKANRMAQAWICVYLYPFFNPRFAKKFASIQLELAQKIGKSCKNRKYPKNVNEIEEIYFEQLRIADKQVVERLNLLEGYSKVMSNLSGLYRQYSEKTTERGTKSIESTSISASKLLKKMSGWCSERAKTWPSFVESHSAYKEAENSKRSFLRRNGPRFVLDFVMASTLYVFVPQGIPFGVLLGEVQRLGVNYVLELIYKPKWQTKSLLKASRNYLLRAERVDRFVQVFRTQFDEKSFVRA